MDGSIQPAPSRRLGLPAPLRRGPLVRLIALNIGYDLGILSPPIFTMLVLMALVTTGMTGPLLTLSDHLRARHALRTKLI